MCYRNTREKQADRRERELCNVISFEVIHLSQVASCAKRAELVISTALLALKFTQHDAPMYCTSNVHDKQTSRSSDMLVLATSLTRPSSCYGAGTVIRVLAPYTQTLSIV